MVTSSNPARFVVTGADGFIGRHVVERLRRMPGVIVRPVVRGTPPRDLHAALDGVAAVLHLAGANRPVHESDFVATNVGFTEALCAAMRASPAAPAVVFASSTQAALDNPYGRSKRAAEAVLEAYALEAQANVVVFRLANVFGKWCRPNYNSFVATLCHGVATGSAYQVTDRTRELHLIHVDDAAEALVAAAFEASAAPRSAACTQGSAGPVYPMAVGDLVDLVESFGRMRGTLLLPDLSNPLIRKLFGTYASYLAPGDFTYALTQRSDERGTLAEFVKSAHAGQIFLSRTRPGIERGNHYHHTKVEKFLVVEGDAMIRFRQIDSADVIEYRVSGRDFTVADIPPGYTHSITNVGSGELIVAFWASEIFEAARPDTIALPVQVPAPVP